MSELTHTPLAPFAASSGPRDAKIALVGEAWGEQEALARKPFIGTSGQELTRMLCEAGIERNECFLTNVFAFRPPNNQLDSLCTNKSLAGKDYPAPALSMGKYVRSEYLGEVQRLQDELSEVKPNIVVALGNTACWSLLGSGKISSIRGATTLASMLGVNKVLATFHPAAVLRQWNLRTIVIADLMKAKRESEYSDLRRPKRWVIVNPELTDLEDFLALARSASIIAVDIETSSGQITHVGFAVSSERALCVPFVDKSNPSGSYWSSASVELVAWNFVQEMLELAQPKLFQNGLYDLSFFARYGLRSRNCLEDTMLRHHAMYLELMKGLGFLGSLYTDESSWKLLRSRHTTEEKRDDE